MILQEYDTYYIVGFENDLGTYTLIKDTLNIKDTNWYVSYALDELPKGIAKVSCTCGGYATYKNYSTEFHSDWCDVTNPVEDDEDTEVMEDMFQIMFPNLLP